MIDFDLFVDGEVIARFGGDGLILSTPIGSTGHNLSAGGPILEQGLSAFVITPICPHMLTDRPVVVRDYSQVEIKMNGDAESVYLTLDGQRGVPLEPTDILRVQRAKEHLQLIQPPKKPYFEILRNKLKWGEA